MKDHNYVDGKCSVCDADDPNYVKPITSLEGLKVFDKYNTKDIIEEVSDATINRAYELSKM